MKNELPTDHGLPHQIVASIDLLPRTSPGSISITDVQAAALAQGVAQGKSLLAVAPTSTGKTLVGIWSMLSWIAAARATPRRAVYLVTHRALARQKFDDFLRQLVSTFFEGDRKAIVLATGDTVQDGDGGIPEAPLQAPLLIATYEKYLGLLSAQGMQSGLSECCIVCDEIQIVADTTRGRNVEMLLTIIRRLGCGQFVGLSAVIDNKDAKELAEWLAVPLLLQKTREKHLAYECRTESKVHRHHTGKASYVESEDRKDGQGCSTPDILAELTKDKTNEPVVIFCMSRRRVYEGAKQLAEAFGIKPTASESPQPLLPGLGERTEAAVSLTRLLAHGIAFHTADLLEEERVLVEKRISEGKVRCVFSTTTLAAGVNFPFRTVVFDEWKRWDGQQASPIPTSEFQNMAGRAGRMGFDHPDGRIVFTSFDGFTDMQHVRRYLEPDISTPIVGRIEPTHFDQMLLQLISSGICSTEEEIEAFVLDTFSAARERERNKAGLAHWTAAIRSSLQNLRFWGFLHA